MPDPTHQNSSAACISVTRAMMQAGASELRGCPMGEDLEAVAGAAYVAMETRRRGWGESAGRRVASGDVGPFPRIAYEEPHSFPGLDGGMVARDLAPLLARIEAAALAYMADDRDDTAFDNLANAVVAARRVRREIEAAEAAA